MNGMTYQCTPRAAVNLTTEEIALIRQRYKNGASRLALAKKYHVSWRTIHRITLHLGRYSEI
jgi:DNA invertase Pin-like site-specific DNA recombinase